MSVQVSIQVNAEPTQALECAYQTLLSLKVKEQRFTDHSFISKNLLFASVFGKFRPAGTGYTWKFFCSLTMTRFAENLYNLAITVGTNDIKESGGGENLALISEFVEKFESSLIT